MSDSQSQAQTEVETANDYEFAVPEPEHDRPERLYIERQLEEAVDEIAPVPVEVNTRFRRTVARGEYDGRTGSLQKIEISWDAFQDEEHYGGDGWAVVIAAVEHLL